MVLDNGDSASQACDSGSGRSELMTTGSLPPGSICPARSALVEALRQEIEQVLNRHSIIVSKMLFSGTHAGDSIPLDLIPALENELLRLRRYANEKGSVRVKQFVIDVTDLATAAKREGNPIVF